MKYTLCALAFALALPLLAFGQSASKQDSGSFVGSWKSLDRENGQSLAEVTIKMAGDKLTGSVLLRDLVKDGKKIVEEFPMSDVMFDGKAFTFKLTFQEANEKTVTDWEFLLRGEEEARFALSKANDKPVEDGPVFVMKRVKTN